MSSALGTDEEIKSQLRRRLDSGLRQIAFLIVPSSVGFLALGDIMASALYQTGRFTHDDAVYVWAILAGSAVGLLASTLGRLYASTYYALHDTRTPLRYAIVRVTLTVVLGYLCAIPLPLALGIPVRWGTAGLTASAGIAGWVEFALLRRSLNRKIGQTGLPLIFIGKLWASAAIAAAIGWAIKFVVGVSHPLLTAVAVLLPYGVTYFILTSLLGLPEARTVLRRFTRLVGRRN